MPRLEDLREQQALLFQESEELVAVADRGEDFTEEQLARSEEIDAQVTELDRQIQGAARMQRIRERSEQSAGRQSEPAAAGHDGAQTAYQQPAKMSWQQRTGQFNTLGDLALAVYNAGLPGMNPANVDPRLHQLAEMAPTNLSSTTVPAEGGYAVPPDFRQFIWQALMGPQSLLPLTDQYPTNYQSVTVPKDELGPWGSVGPQVAWTAEGAQIAQSKINLSQMTVKLEKLTCLLPVTDELLSDSPMIDSYIRSKVPPIMRFAVDQGILNGTGTGQMTGFIGHASTVAVNRASAGTIGFADLQNMLAAFSPEHLGEAVWLCNSSTYPTLMGIAFKDSATNPNPVFLPNFQVADQPYGTLLGRPIIVHPAMPTLGTKGDLALWWPRGYMSVVKAGAMGGLRQDTSIHFFFDYDTMSFRFIFRVNGRPWLDAQLTQPDGSSKWGQTVVLDVPAGP